MSELFDDFNKIFKKDFVPFLITYLKDPNNKINDNLSDFLKDPKTSLIDIFEKFSSNKTSTNNQRSYKDIENVTDIDQIIDDEYDKLLERLILIEENMIQIEKVLKDKN